MKRAFIDVVVAAAAFAAGTKYGKKVVETTKKYYNQAKEKIQAKKNTAKDDDFEEVPAEEK